MAVLRPSYPERAVGHTRVGPIAAVRRALTRAALRWVCSDLEPADVLTDAQAGLAAMRRWLDETPGLTTGQRDWR